MSAKRKTTVTARPDLHDPAAEAALLGCVIVAPEILADVAQQIGPDAFYRPEHRRIFRAIQDQLEDTGFCDMSVLRDRLAEGGDLDDVGGTDYLVRLAESQSDVHAWAYYADAVLEKAAERQGLAALAEMQSVWADTTIPLPERAEQIRRIANNGHFETSGNGGLRPVAAGTVAPRQVEWLVPNMLPLGALTILAGEPGVGKTYVALSLAAAVSQGRPWPTTTQGDVASGGVLYVSDEDAADTTLVPRLIANGAKLDCVHLLETARVGFAIPGDLWRLRAAIRAVPKCRVIVLDPVTSYLNGTDANSNAAVRAALVPLQDLAKAAGVTVLGISHFSKKVDLGALNRTLGSIAFVAAARSVWACVKDRETGGRVLMPVKANLSVEPHGVAYNIEAPDGVVVFDGEPVTGDIDDYLVGGGLKAEATEAAMDWLRERLKDAGDVAAAALIDEAQEAGMSKSTLQRASRRLGVVKTRTNTGGKCSYFWRLP